MNEVEKMKQNIYKDHYQFEWDHRAHLTSFLNIPIAVTTVMGGAVTVMAQKFPYEQSEILTIAFLVCLTLAIICLLLVIW